MKGRLIEVRLLRLARILNARSSFEMIRYSNSATLAGCATSLNRREKAMSQLEYQEFYERNLPHFQPPEATFFVTFRLDGSLPEAALEQWRIDARLNQR